MRSATVLALVLLAAVATTRVAGFADMVRSVAKNDRHATTLAQHRELCMKANVAREDLPVCRVAIVSGGGFVKLAVAMKANLTSRLLGTQLGFTGGHVHQPRYEQVCRGGTGHAEAVAVAFNNTAVAFDEVLQVFLESHDPFEFAAGDGADGVAHVGSQFRSAIFCIGIEQHTEAEAKLRQVAEDHNRTLATRVEGYGGRFFEENDDPNELLRIRMEAEAEVAKDIERMKKEQQQQPQQGAEGHEHGDKGPRVRIREVAREQSERQRGPADDSAIDAFEKALLAKRAALKAGKRKSEMSEEEWNAAKKAGHALPAFTKPQLPPAPEKHEASYEEHLDRVTPPSRAKQVEFPQRPAVESIRGAATQADAAAAAATGATTTVEAPPATTTAAAAEAGAPHHDPGKPPHPAEPVTPEHQHAAPHHGDGDPAAPSDATTTAAAAAPEDAKAN